jgi:hypothetical protein
MRGQKIDELNDPKEQKLSVKTKSVLISRVAKENKEREYKTAILRFFDVNNPHLQDIFPKKIITFTNTEKVRIMDLNVSYYLEGNDIVVNDLEEIYIEHEGHKIYIHGKQEKIERRE